MEGYPLENKNTNEVSKERVVNSLLKDPTDLVLLNKYMDKWEKKVQANYVSREETEKLALEYALDLADLYFLANLKDLAIDAYIDASYVAEGNGWLEKYEEIISKIESIK